MKPHTIAEGNGKSPVLLPTGHPQKGPHCLFSSLFLFSDTGYSSTTAVPALDQLCFQTSPLPLHGGG